MTPELFAVCAGLFVAIFMIAVVTSNKNQVIDLLNMRIKHITSEKAKTIRELYSSLEGSEEEIMDLEEEIEDLKTYAIAGIMLSVGIFGAEQYYDVVSYEGYTCGFTVAPCSPEVPYSWSVDGF